MCAPECRCPWKSEVANLPGASWSYRWLWPSQCEHTQFLIDDLRTPSSIFIYFFKIVLSLTHIIFLEYHIIFISPTPLMVMIFQNPCLSDLKDLCSISEVLFRLHLITMCLVLYLSRRGFLGGGSQEVQYHSHWRWDGFDHAIPVDVNLVSRLGELFSFCTVTFLFDSLCVPSGKVIVCASYFRWELCFTSLKAEELCKLFKILLCDMFLSLIYSVIYVWSYRLMNIYFILCF